MSTGPTHKADPKVLAWIEQNVDIIGRRFATLLRCRGIQVNGDRVDDAIQEAVTKALGRSASAFGTEKRCINWILTVAQRRLIDDFRRRVREAPSGMTVEYIPD